MPMLECPNCHGAQQVNDAGESCPACHGTGKINDSGPALATNPGLLACRARCGCAVDFLSDLAEPEHRSKILALWAARQLRLNGPMEAGDALAALARDRNCNHDPMPPTLLPPRTPAPADESTALAHQLVGMVMAHDTPPPTAANWALMRETAGRAWRAARAR